MKPDTAQIYRFYQDLAADTLLASKTLLDEYEE
jgi:hypothetical protein